MKKKKEQDEKKCPVCSKAVRSDAAIREYCKLCGMGICDPLIVPVIQTKDGTDYFCCDRCYTIYKKNIEKA